LGGTDVGAAAPGAGKPAAVTAPAPTGACADGAAGSRPACPPLLPFVGGRAGGWLAAELDLRGGPKPPRERATRAAPVPPSLPSIGPGLNGVTGGPARAAAWLGFHGPAAGSPHKSPSEVRLAALLVASAGAVGVTVLTATVPLPDMTLGSFVCAGVSTARPAA